MHWKYDSYDKYFANGHPTMGLFLDLTEAIWRLTLFSNPLLISLMPSVYLNMLWFNSFFQIPIVRVLVLEVAGVIIIARDTVSCPSRHQERPALWQCEQSHWSLWDSLVDIWILLWIVRSANTIEGANIMALFFMSFMSNTTEEHWEDVRW